jgi:hypothetical protein
VADEYDQEAHRRELAIRAGTIGADLADCVAECFTLGVAVPRTIYAAIIDLHTWSRELDGVLVTRPHDWPR